MSFISLLKIIKIRERAFIGIVFLLVSCQKLVTVPPPTNELISAVVFTNDATATATITGIYSEMMNEPTQFTNSYLTLYTGLSADELYYYTPDNKEEFFHNEITLRNHDLIAAAFWSPAYKYIYTANLCIEQLEQTTAVSTATKKVLLGEAKFIRAFCYFHLVNLFGGVPLVTNSNYTKSASLQRSPEEAVYNQIIQDLTNAVGLLPAAYAGGEHIRPNKWAAMALLARVHLYHQDWVEAEQAASAVINSGMYQLEDDLNKIFLANSNEAIWELQPLSNGWNTWEAKEILPATDAETPKYLLTSSLLKSFEPGDARRTSWVASRKYGDDSLYYPAKYKVYGNGAPVSEYYIVLRLAEQYLIRAEARAQQGKIIEAQEDLNVIRYRSQLPAKSANNQSSLLKDIAHERQIELLAEWGHRWYDLKRTGGANAILGPLKGSTWQATDVLWPIPINQLNANSSLTQNPGY